MWDPGRVSKRSRINAILRLIRIEHTIFSLPFAYVGAILSGYSFSVYDAILIAFAVFGLRTASMAYNNIADLEIDRKNPRSCKRPLVIGAVKLRDAWMLVLIGSLIYFISSALLNRYALILSPIPWIFAMTYPYAKRLHNFPHIHLGLVLGLAVCGGAVAASGDEVKSIFEALLSIPILYVIAVVLWVAGFDVVYSLLDVEFDRAFGLGSIPAKFGEKNARLIALTFHIISIVLLFLGCVVYNLSLIGIASITFASVLMVYQHYIARTNIPKAFNLNLIISIVISFGIIIDKL